LLDLSHLKSRRSLQRSQSRSRKFPSIANGRESQRFEAALHLLCNPAATRAQSSRIEARPNQFLAENLSLSSADRLQKSAILFVLKRPS
jgi:hypothetical protein